MVRPAIVDEGRRCVRRRFLGNPRFKISRNPRSLGKSHIAGKSICSGTPEVAPNNSDKSRTAWPVPTGELAPHRINRRLGLGSAFQAYAVPWLRILPADSGCDHVPGFLYSPSDTLLFQHSAMISHAPSRRHARRYLPRSAMVVPLAWDTATV